MKFDLVLQTGGIQYRCDGLSLNFAINRIPSASISLAVGRDLQTLEQSAIHSNAASFGVLQPAQIFFAPTGAWSPDDKPGKEQWTKAGTQMIFDGYLGGFGYQKMHGVMRPVVGLAHWLSDMSFSSVLSNDSHPGNPAVFNWNAIRGDRGQQIVGGMPHMIGNYASASVLTSSNIAEDLWGKALHPFFWALSQQDILNKLGGTCDGLSKANNDSQRALARMEIRRAGTDTVGKITEGAKGGGTNITGGGSPYYKALEFIHTGAAGPISNVIAQAIAGYVQSQSEENYFASTAWDKLAGEIGPAFQFSIIPRIKTAMVVPFIPGLRTTFDQEHSNGKSIDLRDVTRIEPNATFIRPIRAVGMLQQQVNPTDPADKQPLTVLGGCYAPGQNKPGMVFYRAPPPWLSMVPSYTNGVDNTAFNARPASSTTPRAPGSIVGNKQGQTPKSVLTSLQDFYVRAAKSFYAQEMLRNRSLNVEGKLRFDLAPGSTVGIINTNPLFLENDQLSGDMVASISRVGIVMHAESGQAGTSFQLDYLRTLKENEDDATSLDTHPLYDTIFTGAPLLHDYLFPGD